MSIVTISMETKPTCWQTKQHRTKFTASTTRRAEPLDLVHSDVCGTMSVESHGGAEYVLRFIDDKTRFVGVFYYAPKIKFSKSFACGREK